MGNALIINDLQKDKNFCVLLLPTQAVGFWFNMLGCCVFNSNNLWQCVTQGLDC